MSVGDKDGDEKLFFQGNIFWNAWIWKITKIVVDFTPKKTNDFLRLI